MGAATPMPRACHRSSSLAAAQRSLMQRGECSGRRGIAAFSAMPGALPPRVRRRASGMRWRSAVLRRWVCWPNVTGRLGALPTRHPFGLRRVVRGSERRGPKTTWFLSSADQGDGKGADQCCSADAQKEFLAPAHSLGFQFRALARPRSRFHWGAERLRSTHGGPRADRFSREPVGGGDGL